MRSHAIDGFELEYDRKGDGPPVVLLHGWPGDRGDYRGVVGLLENALVPDLRGFGGSGKHSSDPADYNAEAQARSVLGLLDELGIDTAVFAGYDVGSRVAQAIARDHGDRVRALVLAPPVPGIGRRVLEPDPVGEFWYQSFHRLDLAEALIDGNPQAARAYLTHFWSHWSGPGFTPDDAELDRLAATYGAPGGFVASIHWYRAGAGSIARALTEQTPDRADRIQAPTTILWPAHDPLFPPAWSDRIDDYFADATLTMLSDRTGHFVPVEAPETFAQALAAAI